MLPTLILKIIHKLHNSNYISFKMYSIHTELLGDAGKPAC